MNRQLFKNNGHSKFPMSTDALDFIQEQIFLAYQLSYLAGDNVIIRNSTASQSGLCIYGGELLPLTGTPAKYIFVNSAQQSVTANGETFDNVRTTRTAIYTDANMGKPVSAFATLTDLVTLKEQLTYLQTNTAFHQLPQGAVIDWYGTCDADHVPYGYIPCGKFKSNGGEEETKWKNKYTGRITLSSATESGGTYTRITKCLDFDIPDLTDRFIVQAGHNYSLGALGGEAKHTLTMAEMPKHNHTGNSLPEADHTVTTSSGKSKLKLPANAGGSDTVRSGSYLDVSSSQGSSGNEISKANMIDGGHTHDFIMYARGSSQSHENRPPYYALYKLIKVI